MAKGQDIRTRFYNLVDQNGPWCTGTNSRCWVWTGQRTKQGYGQLRVGKRKKMAHRVSYELHNDYELPPHPTKGRPEDICVLHRCDNKRCVNPTHLFLGTRKDNAVDRDNKGRHAKERCAKKGETNGIAFLTDDLIREMRVRWARGEFETYKQLGAAYGTVPENASGIVRRRFWKHVV